MGQQSVKNNIYKKSEDPGFDSLVGQNDSQGQFLCPSSRPDMTFAFDWALKTNYLSICPSESILVQTCLCLTPPPPPPPFVILTCTRISVAHVKDMTIHLS